jgi:hypothetical protein
VEAAGTAYSSHDAASPIAKEQSMHGKVCGGGRWHQGRHRSYGLQSMETTNRRYYAGAGSLVISGENDVKKVPEPAKPVVTPSTVPAAASRAIATIATGDSKEFPWRLERESRWSFQSATNWPPCSFDLDYSRTSTRPTRYNRQRCDQRHKKSAGP